MRTIWGMLAVSAWATLGLAESGAPRPLPQESGELVLPMRRSQPPPSPPPPPPLPAGADAVPASTFQMATVRRGPAGRETRTAQSIARTGHSLAIVSTDGAEEWLFERNPIDPRRVAGYRVDHSQRQILVYDESDLRTRLQVRGWADVLTLRFPVEALATLRATGEREHAGDVAFERYVSKEDGATGVLEVWWSEALLLPLRLTLDEGGTRTTSVVESLVSGVEAPKLSMRIADPRRRFPAYEVLDIGDAADHRH